MKKQSTIFTEINDLLIAIKVSQLKGNKTEAKLLDKKLFKIQEKLNKEKWKRN